MSNQTKMSFQEAFTQRSSLSGIGARLFRRRYSPTLAMAIQDIFLEEDINTEVNAIQVGAEVEAVQFLSHRFFSKLDSSGN